MKELIKKIVEMLANIGLLTPKRVAKLRYMYIMHRRPHFEHPRDLNEKINWMKFYGDTSQWTRLADKYAVREWVAEKVGEDVLVPLIGHWKNVEDIDFDALPNRFVMKTNNGSGDVVVCHDKSRLNIVQTKAHFRKELHRTFGIVSGETHYANIPPCIIAEELLDAGTQPCGSTSLVDYKFWCVNGQPKYVWCCYNRQQFHANVGVYDMRWLYHPEYSIFTSHYVEADQLLPRPACFDRMKEIAAKLAQGFPVVRVDLYEVNGLPYFGEMTFTSQSGCMDYFTNDFLLKMGQMVDLGDSIRDIL